MTARLDQSGPAGLDGALVEQCLRGDRGAFESLYRRYASRLYAMCCNLMGDSADAEDLMQMTFDSAFRKLSSFRGDSRFYTWLGGIAVKTAANQRRSRKGRARVREAMRRSRRPSQSIERQTPERQAAHGDLWRLILAAIEELPEKKRVAFILHVLEDHAVTDVAAMTRASIQTTHARIKSARQHIIDRVRAQEATP